MVEPSARPRAWVESLTFSDGSELVFGSGDIVLIVGPNNSGKSAALRAIRDKFEDASKGSPVVIGLRLAKDADGAAVTNWLDAVAFTSLSGSEKTFVVSGVGLVAKHVTRHWGGNALGPLWRIFCHLLTADARLKASDPADSIPIATAALTHPIHYLQRDDRLELRLSQQFRSAFGVDLIVHRNAGSTVPLYTGQRPVPAAGEDRVSLTYVQAIEKLPPLQQQGDGMRSFAGVLLETSVGTESVLLIDEPEAFLHPPQARQLGRMLLSEAPQERQMFVATHSGDFLRGALDGESDRVRVVRIQRDGSVNRVWQLENGLVRALWGDPLLRHSNILDGLFHEGVIVVESDADAKFYSGVSYALSDRKGQSFGAPDRMFVHGGGKSRLPVIVKSLRRLGVPIRAVADFDVLNDEHPLSDLVEAAGGDWGSLSGDWKTVKNAVDEKKPELATGEVREEITKILAAVSEPHLPKHVRPAIEKILRRASPWASANEVGKSYVPSGTATQACERFLKTLEILGIFVVETGEMESFARSVGGHSSVWVNEVLKKDVINDPELQGAREFVLRLMS